MSGMEEAITYVEAIVTIGVLIYIGACVLDKLSGAGMISSTGAFNGTVDSVASMWTSASGMVSTVVVIGAAAIIIKMVMSFRNKSSSQ